MDLAGQLRPGVSGRGRANDRTGVPPPCPTLLSTRPSTANGAVDSDEDGNVYWNTSGVELGAGGTKSWSWTNRIWPGE